MSLLHANRSILQFLESCKGFFEQKSAGRPGNWLWFPKTFRIFSRQVKIPGEKSHRIFITVCFVTEESEWNADFRVQHKTLLLNHLRLSLSLVFLKAFPRLPPFVSHLAKISSSKDQLQFPRIERWIQHHHHAFQLIFTDPPISVDVKLLERRCKGILPTIGFIRRHANGKLFFKGFEDDGPFSCQVFVENFSTKTW